MKQRMEAERSGHDSMQVFDPRPGTLYSLETVMHLTGVSRRSILVYCKSGLVHPAGELGSEVLSFDDEAIYSIRRIEHLRELHGINLAGIRMIFDLMRELRRLEEEMRFLRS